MMEISDDEDEDNAYPGRDDAFDLTDKSNVVLLCGRFWTKPEVRAAPLSPPYLSSAHVYAVTCISPTTFSSTYLSPPYLSRASFPHHLFLHA
jgi:hypothetical protein